MAIEPGLSELVTTTLRRRRGVLTNNIENHNPIMVAMKKYDSIDMEPGGRTLVDEAWFDQNNTVMHYFGGQVLNTAYNPTMTSFEVDWKQIAGAVVINGREERMNSGQEAKIKLLKGRMDALEFSLENFFEQDLVSDGTGDGGLQVGGIKYWISSTPSTGTIGTIDRSTSAGAFARNVKFDTVNDSTSGAPGGSATTSATIRPYLNYCINSTTRGSDRVKVLLMGQSHFEFLQSAMQALQRITSESQTAESGFQFLNYEGIPAVMAGGVNFSGATKIATDRTYGVNTRFTKLRIHKDAYFDPLPEVQSINQDAKVGISVFMGNMTCSAPKLNFVMFDS